MPVRRRLPFASVLLSVWLLTPLHGQPAVQETVRIRHYDVVGTTAAALDRSLDGAGPRRDGRPFAGYTHTALEWRFTSARDFDGCGVTAAHVRVDAEITLPRWTPPQDAEAGLRKAWVAFADALHAHENGHVDLARAAARALHDTLSFVRGATCDEVEREANAAGQRVLGRLEDAHRRYDTQTRHGAVEGVVRPSVALGAEAAELRQERSVAAGIVLVMLVLLLWIARRHRGTNTV
jgi:predicted secreted Zn-dependent protease